MASMNEEDLEAKQRFIDAYFREVEDRISFLGKLIADGRELEAMILTCAYIEGIGNCLSPNCSNSAKNFEYVICKYGNEIVLKLVSPNKLIESLPKGNSKEKLLVKSIDDILGSYKFVLMEKSEVIDILKAGLDPNNLEWINNNIWRGTLANFAYIHIRSAAIKTNLAWSTYSFSKTTYNGNIMDAINFTELLYKALSNIVVSVVEISKSTGKFYGTDLGIYD
jgi:hypothetical protein